MGINTLTVAWLSRLASRAILKQGQSIIEFSPQDLVMVSRNAVAHFALRHNSAALTDSLLDRVFDGANPRPDGTAAFYRLFGIERYRSADLLDGRADWKRDFNEPFRLREQFDVATNFGTAEHVFNIGNMFRSVHDVLRPGGVALHILPTFGDIDHGFFNIHPTTYLDLAAANDYVIEDLCYVDRWDIRDKVLAADVKSDFDFEALPIRFDHLKDRPTLQRMVTELFIENYRREDTQRIGQQYPGVFYDYCCVALRKTGSAAFRIPMQGYYGGGAAMEKMGARPIWLPSGTARRTLRALLRSPKELRRDFNPLETRLALRVSQEGIVKGVAGHSAVDESVGFGHSQCCLDCWNSGLLSVNASSHCSILQRRRRRSTTQTAAINFARP